MTKSSTTLTSVTTQSTTRYSASQPAEQVPPTPQGLGERAARLAIRAGIARAAWAVWDIEDAGTQFSSTEARMVRGRWLPIDLSAPTREIALGVARVYTVTTKRATLARLETRLFGLLIWTTTRGAAGFLADQDDGGTPSGARLVDVEIESNVL